MNQNKHKGRERCRAEKEYAPSSVSEIFIAEYRNSDTLPAVSRKAFNDRISLITASGWAAGSPTELVNRERTPGSWEIIWVMIWFSADRRTPTDAGTGGDERLLVPLATRKLAGNTATARNSPRAIVKYLSFEKISNWQHSHQSERWDATYPLDTPSGWIAWSVYEMSDLTVHKGKVKGPPKREHRVKARAPAHINLWWTRLWDHRVCAVDILSGELEHKFLGWRRVSQFGDNQLDRIASCWERDVALARNLHRDPTVTVDFVTNRVWVLGLE